MVADELIHYRSILKKTEEKGKEAGRRSLRLREVCVIHC